MLLKRKNRIVRLDKKYYDEPVAHLQPDDYKEPQGLKSWMASAPGEFRKTFMEMGADEYNAGNLDKYIDRKMDVFCSDYDLQQVKRSRDIGVIKSIQKSQLRKIQKRMDDLKDEAEKLSMRHPEYDSVDLRYVKKRQGRRTPFYRKLYCSLGVLILSMILDFAANYQVFEALIYDNMFMQILLTLGLSMLLDVPANVAGVFMKSSATKAEKRMVTILLLTTFLISFLIVAGIRFTTTQIMYADPSQIAGLETAVTGAGSDTYIFLTILFSVLPALTSVLSFVFGYLSMSPKEAETQLEEIRFVKICGELERLSGAVFELGESLEKENTLELEQELYEIQLDATKRTRELLKETARVELAKVLHNEEAAGVILES